MKEIEQVYQILLKGNIVSTDSRTVSEGTIFFALKGENFDGNKFAKSSIDKGATLAVVDDPKLKDNSKMLLVPDVLSFLQQLAIHHREKLSIPVIGLTGSNGKTTTKELLKAVLSKKYKTFATDGNLNNHIGVPLSVLSIGSDVEIAIIEMGANHTNEISHLCSISKPNYGLITNIGKAHLEGFGSFEGVKKAKSELYQWLAYNKGTVFFNGDNLILIDLIKEKGIVDPICYGSKIFNVVKVDNLNNRLSFEFTFLGSSYSISTQLVGSYNIENILAAICVGVQFGVSVPEAISAISEYLPSNKRSQVVKTKNNVVILDAYNANPSSMELAIKNFSEFKSEQPKLAILGEMLELGDYSREEHSRIAKIALNSIENVIFVGKGFKEFNGTALWFSSLKDCILNINSKPLSQNTILLKGSRGVKLDELLPYL
jgi:UDP-N-acetylmuramoyl-tripeptide--D-alanyl-D-alanine ligase